MLKLYISLCLALVVGTLTLTNGILHDARLAIIAYRVVISVVLFGIIGYALGIVGEKFYREMIAKSREHRQDSEVVSTKSNDHEVIPESEFSPFASDSFEQISRPKE